MKWEFQAAFLFCAMERGRFRATCQKRGCGGKTPRSRSILGHLFFILNFGAWQNLNSPTWSGDGSSPTIEFHQNEMDGIFEKWRRAVAAPLLSCREMVKERFDDEGEVIFVGCQCVVVGGLW